MEIEMYVGVADNTWYTTTVEIPDDTPEKDINDVAADKLMREFEKKGVDVAFVGAYHRGE
jgi:hypothetical protein